ncbi:MAG TPA: helix-turn-helix transcriptional regulator [Chloroflexota bacterium]|nr:helix-turn-helix transcriptional regulator [Chloroflexota bacterium]
MASDERSFGYLLRRYRLAALLTQEQLAERAHLSHRTISDLEGGAKHSPRRDTVLLLADALERSGDWSPRSPDRWTPKRYVRSRQPTSRR